MNVTTNVASAPDLAFLGDVDTHVSPGTLADLVSLGRVMVVEVDGEAVGFLRWGLFWDQIPFMNLLWVLPDWRNQGVGTTLVGAWEQSQLAAGHDLALTSTMSNERSQHFYRRLVMSTPEPYCCPTNPAELILRKPLAQ